MICELTDESLFLPWITNITYLTVRQVNKKKEYFRHLRKKLQICKSEAYRFYIKIGIEKY